MGAAASLGVAAGISATSAEELSKVSAGLSPEEKKKITSALEQLSSKEEAKPAEEPKKEEPPAEEEEEEEDDVEDELDEPPPEKKTGGPRSSVSAEAYGAWNVKKAFDASNHNYPKTDEQKARIKDVLGKSFLFMSVDEANFTILLNAVQEVKLEPKERIIKKGEDGDFMCIIESGTFKCYVPDGEEEKCVKTCEPGDVFGELALMYSCPRAASVEADTEGTAWKLDREVFNAIVRDAAQKKREKWEGFLKKVPILENMDDYQRSQLTDALKEETFEDGKVIITEGEEGDTFMILAEGAASAVKGESTIEYAPGDFFGELALLKNQPRAATVTSKGCKVLTLNRVSFNRLLDPATLSTKSYE
eukprot:gnl/MRDRNA2_/MRDRNA2_88082_c0_seq1.p1 gnl/MRDRNA2_/MRDRNA2_88082_c0~~gnl/MRDRNA2_/MRDRNA2_88082_c0_seq1.p1  ORF type:complete len:362 (-),score=123.46 gnl/MRDRNA2_/MRDRNA2_88082_c0_seq1:387-1472(-)